MLCIKALYRSMSQFVDILSIHQLIKVKMSKKNVILFLFMVLSVVLFLRPIFAEESKEKALNLLNEGNVLYDEGLYKEAVEKYRKSWELAKLQEACYNLATTLDIELNRNKEATVYYKRYLALLGSKSKASNNDESDEVSELNKKAKQDYVKEESWRGGTKKASKDVVEYLLKEYRDIQQIKYDDTSKKELQDDTGKPFKASASVCLGCHATFMGPKINMNTTHPVGKIPKGKMAETVPKNVRFYKEGRVICLSCHNPQILHFESGSKGKTYRVLRVDTGKKGENMPKFCAFCHREKSSTKFLETGDDSGSSKRMRRRRRRR